MNNGMLIDLHRCVGCNACAIACSRVNHTPSEYFYTHIESYEEGTYPNVQLKLQPFNCQHCSNAPCVRVCPTGASYYDENGSVQIDHDKCIGCRMCMGACPYHARFFNWGSADKTPYFEGKELTPLESAHAAEHPAGVVEKCILCKDRTAQGLEPACVQTCPANARIFGDIDDPDSTISKEIAARGAKIYKEELGTRPNVYYVGLS